MKKLPYGLILILVILVSLPCYDVIANETPRPSSLDSLRQGGDAPFWTDPKFDLPWFLDARSKIARSIANKKDVHRIFMGIGCTFYLEPTGQVSDLFMFTYPRKSTLAVDPVALDVVKNAGPFAAPPDSILHKRRLLVYFTRYPEFDLKVDSHDYSFCKDRDAGFQEIKEKHLRFLEKVKQEAIKTNATTDE